MAMESQKRNDTPLQQLSDNRELHLLRCRCRTCQCVVSTLLLKVMNPFFLALSYNVWFLFIYDGTAHRAPPILHNGEADLIEAHCQSRIRYGKILVVQFEKLPRRIDTIHIRSTLFKVTADVFAMNTSCFLRRTISSS